jgi:hypothetical protein
MSEAVSGVYQRADMDRQWKRIEEANRRLDEAYAWLDARKKRLDEDDDRHMLR